MKKILIFTAILCFGAVFAVYKYIHNNYEATNILEYIRGQHSQDASNCIKAQADKRISDNELEAVCRKPAEQGNAESQATMGLIANTRAINDPSKHEDAVHWFTLAANQGNEIASANLAAKYFRGQGVEKNPIN